NLDDPLPVQYLDWVGDIARGDFGESLLTTQDIGKEIRKRFPVTAELAVLAVLFSIVIGLPAGVIAAIRQDTPLDYVVRVLSILGLAVPGFWLASLIITLPAIWWQTGPPLGHTPFLDDPIENLKAYATPAILLGLAQGALLMRLTRSGLIEVMRQDYIRTAWSKGLRERVVILRHAMRNALIPVITVMGLQLTVLLGGTVIQEQIFLLPGLGFYLLQAISLRDYPVLQTVILLLTVIYVVVNLIVDLTYGYLDPRIRYS
ncbi:MAG TPA: ABC transporter permease, partial [Dehalococcoidia bacterium]|nr:ABC transporter permease [Dehalococcoidia bacterium]